MPRTATEKFLKARDNPHKVMLDKDFAGVKAGLMLFIASPRIVADYIRAIPAGQTSSVDRMRIELARRHRADATCPVSTAIFVRMAADYAVEELHAGKDPADVLPFWRLLSGTDKIARKLRIDPQWIDDRRAAEAA